ncbi:MAG: DUF721 domain-containing protein [Thalassotalea sp.]
MSLLFKTSSGTLAQIKSKTNSLSLISDIVRQICPDLPVEAWKVGNISAQTLVIEVKTAAWSQRFQFERNNITRELQRQTDGVINNIEIKIHPFTHRNFNTEVPPEKTQFISEKTAKQLREVAKSAPESLKRKLESLANLVKQRNS